MSKIGSGALLVILALCCGVGGGGCGDDSGNGGDPMPFDFCTPGQAPDAACYASKRDPSSDNVALARAIADKQIEEHTPDTLTWDWGESVMLVGFHELYRVTGDAKYRDYYKSYIDHHVEAGYEMDSSDTSAPARLALELHVETGEQKYAQVVDDFETYIHERALRTDYGGINHLGTEDLFGISIWVDSLFMFGGVLIRLGETRDDSRALGLFAEQHQIFTDVLQEAPGWYRHADGWPGAQTPDVYWGRGNGWVTVAGYDYLRLLSLRGESDEHARAALEEQAAAVVAAQDADTGLYWTVLNRPGESYLETSAPALFAYGLARAYRYGLQDGSVLPTIERAMVGVKARIEEDDQGRPVVTGVSSPTTVGTFDYYAELSTTDDISYGLGSVILALIETSGLE